MVTFNVDSLDFVDDEEARFGTDSDFGISYDSDTDALAIQDRINSAMAAVPRGADTDLVGGKFAETVSEGKALADDGSVYDTIQQAVNNASSWVKVGPGDFRESVTIDTEGLTLEGSGERTIIFSSSEIGVEIISTDVTVSNLSVKSTEDHGIYGNNADNILIYNIIVKYYGGAGIRLDNSPNSTIDNCTVENGVNRGINPSVGSDASIVKNCIVKSTKSDAAYKINGDDIIVINNISKNSGTSGVSNSGNDCIIIGNRIENSDSFGIYTYDSADTIVANNRISDSTKSGIKDQGAGTVLDANLVTE